MAKHQRKAKAKLYARIKKESEIRLKLTPTQIAARKMPGSLNRKKQ